MSLTKKRDLLRDLHRQHAEKKPTAERPAKIVSKPRPAFDFVSHPAYDEVRFVRSACDAIGIASPFFRQIEAVRGTQVRIGGVWCENFASYDYLGLNGSEAVRGAAAAAAQTWGVSATASRLVGGERSIHAELEAKLAAFVGTDAALVMVSGHATNISIIRTLMRPGDLIMVDALAHNSIYEGIKASGATHVTFPHNDWNWLDARLEEVRDAYANVLVVVEGLYSMDGDAPDLARFIDVKSRHGAWLMVDEAHSIGVLGATGRGICEEQGIDPGSVEIIMGTLSKTFSSCGGFVAGPEALIDLMRYKAPGFVYSVGLSAPNTAAAMSAVDKISAEPERAQRLRALGKHFLETAQSLDLDCGANQGYAVAPIVIGDSARATWVSNQLLGQGINVLPIIAPAVPNKSARLRFFLNHGHQEAQLTQTLHLVADLFERVRVMSLDELRD